MRPEATAQENGGGESLLRNTLLVVGVAAMLASAFFILVTLLIMQRQVGRQYQEQLRELTESMSSMASVACFARDATLAKETVDAFIKHSAVRRVSIWAYGELLATGAHSGDGPSAGGGPFADEKARIINQALYSPFVPDEKIGEIALEPDWDVIQAKIADSTRNVALLFFLLSAGIVGIIAVVISLIIVRPVKVISDNLHTLDTGSPDKLATPPGHEADELGRLVKDMNDLLFRLRTSLTQEHELHLQRVLNERLRLYATIFEHSQEGILITDRDNRIVAVNRAFSRITGYSESDVLGENPNLMSSGRHDQAFYEKLWNELVTTGHWKGELWNRCKDGRIKPELCSISIVHDDRGEVANYISVFSDISERKKDEERIEFLAHHDPLTRLPNRLLTRERFSLAAEAAARDKSAVAMLYIDLDGFKYVNDTFGHPVGDQLLLSVAERLKSQVRETDTISRQGGDEFMILLPGIRDTDVTHRITTGILDKLSSPFGIAGRAIGISASIGVAYYPQHGEDFDTVMKNADAAMYSAKNSGKNASRVFHDEMSVDVLDKLVLRAHLSHALQNGEIYIVFQPQINTTTERIVGAEVLCRWTHPDIGIVPPSRFIPLAEESGLINPLSEWILEQACLQGRRWFDAGIPPFVIAVNVSSRQFNHGDLVDTVGKTLEKTGFPAKYLELEFTESGLLKNVDHSLETIEKLRTLGVKLSIDDFGTGYSSLVYLKQFKMEKLKIDQSFVRDIDNSEDLGIVRAIVQMGQTLQLGVIAEGVETERQMTVLKSLGCHEIQGYLISKPLPQTEFENFVTHWNTRHASGG
ncbi:MAG: EAL domain-containing protein [Candidatus Accumulibacter sp.]|jgi:diguanylate cyclase (GGDEF)-like protein/PAS domain S-box-containing protein|nr:EAL domain-containing protein [Accumulibacter sp.]